MTRAEEILKFLELDYKTVSPDAVFKIRPLDFMVNMDIVLVVKNTNSYEMFIWEDYKIVNPIRFTVPEGICDAYSLLYNFKAKQLGRKTKIIRKQD